MLLSIKEFLFAFPEHLIILLAFCLSKIIPPSFEFLKNSNRIERISDNQKWLRGQRTQTRYPPLAL